MSAPESQQPAQTPVQEARLLRLATGSSVVVAAVLILVKMVAVALTGSVALLASLIDSFIDAAASILNLLAVRYALAPADREHRFGHGKAESLAALLQALLILGSSAFLIFTSVQRLAEPEPLRAASIGIAVMIFSLAATGALVLLQLHVIRRTDSAAIRADSLHYRSDFLSNLAVLAALALAEWGVQRADPLLALGIALYLIFASREILRQALNELLDRELPREQRQRILNCALEHPSVHGVHDLRTRRSGRTVIAQLHIELDGDMSLFRAHRIADEVETSIIALIPGADVVIHQDPAGLREARLDTQLARTETS